MSQIKSLSKFEREKTKYRPNSKSNLQMKDIPKAYTKIPDKTPHFRGLTSLVDVTI